MRGRSGNRRAHAGACSRTPPVASWPQTPLATLPTVVTPVGEVATGATCAISVPSAMKIIVQCVSGDVPGAYVIGVERITYQEPTMAGGSAATALADRIPPARRAPATAPPPPSRSRSRRPRGRATTASRPARSPCVICLAVM